MIEQWRVIEYSDIIRNKYEVSNTGKVRNIKTGKLLHGNNVLNEKGYVRVCLQTYSKPRKFSVHRLVLFAFSEHPSCELEVNHINPGFDEKSNNNINNLEYVTRYENAHHAAINHMYKTCDEHHKSILTNSQVNQICMLLTNGVYSNKIISILGLEDIPHIKTYVSRIKKRITWTDISYKYDWDDDMIKYKTYTKQDIQLICQYIFINKLKSKQIALLFPQYEYKKLYNVIKKIKNRKLYKSISDKYICEKEGSTTIENDIYYVIDIK